MNAPYCHPEYSPCHPERSEGSDEKTKPVILNEVKDLGKGNGRKKQILR